MALSYVSASIVQMLEDDEWPGDFYDMGDLVDTINDLIAELRACGSEVPEQARERIAQLDKELHGDD